MKQLYGLIPYQKIPIQFITLFKNVKNIQYYKISINHLKRVQFKWISYIHYSRRRYYVLPLDYLESAIHPDRIFWCIIHSREIESARDMLEFDQQIMNV